MGGADRERVPFIAALNRLGVSVAVYGDYWNRYPETRASHRGYGDIATLRKATSAAKVNLCLVRRANRDGQVMRSYEAAAIGSCMLVEDTPEHRELFGPDGETVVYFETIDDMLRRLQLLLDAPDERARLRRAVQQPHPGGTTHLRRSSATHAASRRMIATQPVSTVGTARNGVVVGLLLTAWRQRALVLFTTCMVSLMFGIPHLLIPALLGEGRVYTPFAVSGVSALTYDETSSYAAYVNYTLHHLAPPYDTDVFENENVPVPTTMAPYAILAAAAALVGGVDRAFMLADFIVPPLALLILYALLFDITRRQALSLVGALASCWCPLDHATC